MITKEEFKKLIEDYMEQCEAINNIEKVLDANLAGTKWVDYGFWMFDKVVNILFGEDNAGIIYSYVHWSDVNPDEKQIDVYGDLVPCKDVDELYEIIKSRMK